MVRSAWQIPSRSSLQLEFTMSDGTKIYHTGSQTPYYSNNVNSWGGMGYLPGSNYAYWYNIYHKEGYEWLGDLDNTTNGHRITYENSNSTWSITASGDEYLTTLKVTNNAVSTYGAVGLKYSDIYASGTEPVYNTSSFTSGSTITTDDFITKINTDLETTISYHDSTCLLYTSDAADE